MNKHTAKAIANAYLPSRWHYHYTQAKLNSDPLFDGVCNALANTTAPLLDLGCGIGLLAHCLHAHEQHLDYLGIDHDRGKIVRATQAAAVAGLHTAQFKHLDLATDFPDHRGSVTLLDVLQYLAPAAQVALLNHACRCLTPAATLIIRTGITEPGWRSKLTYAADWFTRGIGWMNSSPQRHPSKNELQSVLTAHRLRAEFLPMWGDTPFNNWLIVAQLE